MAELLLLPLSSYRGVVKPFLPPVTSFRILSPQVDNIDVRKPAAKVFESCHSQKLKQNLSLL